ncbi:MAG: DNA-binding XRE family transcriptional regulator [Candidatus Marinamargulisbacteria bacterium]|jgi:DNA-binding XRE family transcriptional regulator
MTGSNSRKFGDLLSRFRTQNADEHWSQATLAKAIGTSRQYIDAIEKKRPQSTPPNLEKCLVLASVLKLDSQSKTIFLSTAFKERLKQNADFYTHLHPEREAKTKGDDSPGFDLSIIEPIHESRLVYLLQWSIRPQNPSLDIDVQAFVGSRLSHYFKKHRQSLYTTKITDSQVVCMGQFSANVHISKFTDNLKSFLSEDILNGNFSYRTKTPSVWRADSQIVTLGNASLNFAEKKLDSYSKIGTK